MLPCEAFAARHCLHGTTVSEGPLQVQAQMQAMQEQMQRPEVQEQMKEAHALMQDKGFAEKVGKLKVSIYVPLDVHLAGVMWYASCPSTSHAMTIVIMVTGHNCSLQVPFWHVPLPAESVTL